MYRFLRNASKIAVLLLALCTLVINTSPTFAVVRTWTTFGSGNFNDPGNWFPSGVPGPGDFVSFEVGFSPYTVTFPGNELQIGGGTPPAHYMTSELRVRDSGVTFSGSSQPLRTPSIYTVTSANMSEADRGIIIGDFGGENAVLNISDFGIACCGGLSSLNGVAATLGNGAGASGTLNVTNAGTFNVTGSDFTATQLIVGNHGTGTINVINGSDVNVPGSNSKVSLGQKSTGVGMVNISGAGSSWTNGNQLWVGEFGSGTLTVQNGGGLVTSSTAGFSNVIGVFGGSNGMVRVTGPGSTWTNSNALRVGNSGDGTLVIENGGSLISSSGPSIGGGFSASGTATVTGPGSTMTTPGMILIEGFGMNSTGALAVLNGGSVSSGSALIRALNDGSAEALVTGAGSTWTVTNTLTVGLPEPGFTTGPTTLTINPGATVNVGGDLDISINGVTELHGGTLIADEIRLLQGGGDFDFTSGRLQIGGFSRNLLNQGGTFSPGLDVGTTVINGDYTQQDGGALEIEIGGDTPGDEFDVVELIATLNLGAADLDGNLKLFLLDGFEPDPADTFTVLTADGGITGAFSNVANGQRLTTFDGLGSFLVHYGVGSSFDPNHMVLSAFEAVPLAGDYNMNGVVDAADYTIWRDTLGATGAGLAADGNGNGEIDTGDYDIWKTHFGEMAGSGSAASGAIPEPGSIVLAVFGLMLAGVRQLRRRTVAAIGCAGDNRWRTLVPAVVLNVLRQNAQLLQLGRVTAGVEFHHEHGE